MRSEIVPKQNETIWSQKTNEFIGKNFNVGKTLPVVFVDSHFRRKDPLEKSAFEKNGNELRDILKAINGTFEFKDINAVQSELGLLKARAFNLTDEISTLDLQVKNLTQENMVLRFLRHQHKVWYEEHKFTFVDLITAAMGGLASAGKAWSYSEQSCF